MADERTKTYAEIAASYADIAGTVVVDVDKAGADKEKLAFTHALQLAQVAATLSVGARLAALGEVLGDYMGDDSYLDRTMKEVRDLEETLRTGLDEIRTEIGKGLGT